MHAAKLRIKSLKSAGKARTQGFAHPERNVAALGIKPGMSVADFGSGSGAYVLAIADALRGLGHIYAIDIQRDLLLRTKNEAMSYGYKNAEVVWGDVERPGGSKLAEESIDLVLISNLLFQLTDKFSALREARRILKPNGRMAIIDWTDSPPPPTGRQNFARIGPGPKYVVGEEKAEELAREAGFEFVHEFSAGAHHYGLIFKKK